MTFVLSREQESIREAARRFFRERAPVDHLRRLRDEGDATGFSRDVWREMAALGFVGMAIPEEHGGAGLGFAELGLVLEEMGKNLSPSPLISTALLGAIAIQRAGSEARRAALLPAIASGEHLLALAHEEGTRHAPHAIKTSAKPAPGGFCISGEKVFVLEAIVADSLVIVARTSGGAADRDGITLFLVPSSRVGIERTRTPLIDSRGAARVHFESVFASNDEVVGEIDRGADALDAALDRAAIGLAAEMLGSAQEAFDRTIAYLKERRQFGVPIGSFQALQHRAALLFCEIELTRSVVMAALRAVDEGRPDVPLLASAAKARASDTFLLVTAEAIQMHGGVGVTDELDIGFFLKRARTTEALFGDAAYHRGRFARLSGY